MTVKKRRDPRSHPLLRLACRVVRAESFISPAARLSQWASFKMIDQTTRADELLSSNLFVLFSTMGDSHLRVYSSVFPMWQICSTVINVVLANSVRTSHTFQRNERVRENCKYFLDYMKIWKQSNIFKVLKWLISHNHYSKMLIAH